MTKHSDLAARLASTTAADIMQRRVITVSYAASVTEVERVLAENRVTGVPVTDSAGKVVGVISVRDLLDYYAEEPDAHRRRGRGFFGSSNTDFDEDEDFGDFGIPDEAGENAESLMNAEVYTVPADCPLPMVAKKLTEHRIHRVLVTDPETRQVVGLISSLDVLAALAD